MLRKGFGFTLVELLVVIAVISILSTIGMVTYTKVQGNARDAKRRSDIEAIASALEIKKGTNSSYQQIAQTDFGSGMPTEPLTGRTQKYCYKDDTAAVPNPDPWGELETAACPDDWQNINEGVPTVGSTATYFNVCALSESKTEVFCMPSRQ